MNEVRLDLSWGTKMALLIVVTVLLRTISGIVVPGAFWHELEESERITSDKNINGNRSLIMSNTVERYERKLQFLRSTPCIATFLQNRSISFRYSTSVVPFIFDHVEHRTPVEIDLLMHTLQTEIATYTVNKVYGEDHSQNFTSNMIVIVIEQSVDLERINCTYYRRMCSTECEFVLIVTSIFEDEENFLREADNLQQSMWYQWVGRLLILGSTRDTVLLAGSWSFKPEEFCVPSEPILLGSCRTNSISSVWRFDAGLITGRDFTLNGCTLVVAYYDNPPYSFGDNETADERIFGLEGLMVEEILYSMNARLLREMISRLSANDSYEGNLKAMDQVVDNSGMIDLLIGGLLWNPAGGTDFTIAYDMVPIVWMVPVKANVSLRGLVAPFSTFVWIAILCVILLGILVKRFFIKDISFLDTLALILSVSVFRQPTRPSSRILFISWTFFGFFMSQYYLASLADQLVNASNLQIETMKELLSSGLELGGTSQFADLFDEVDEQDDDVQEDVIIRTIRERFHVLPQNNYTQRLSNLLNGKDQRMALVVELNTSNSGLNLPKQYVHALKESMGNYPLAMATRKGFPFLRKINIKMQELIEAGIIEYWARLITLNGTYYRPNEKTKSDNDVTLESVAPGFLLLVIGYLTGFCVLIIEIIAYPSKWLS